MRKRLGREEDSDFFVASLEVSIIYRVRNKQNCIAIQVQREGF